MNTQRLGAIALVVLAAGTIASAQKVTSDSDPAAPFSTYKTYMWTAGIPAADGLQEQRIHEGVDAQLSAKGLRKVATDADLAVATLVKTQEHRELIADGFGYGPWWGAGPVASVQTYVQGMLIVDLYDAHTKKMVWRGTATDTVSSKPEKNAARINKGLAKLFTRYPAVSAAN
jgi:Domain of unknown function (DUF4136)